MEYCQDDAGGAHSISVWSRRAAVSPFDSTASQSNWVKLMTPDKEYARLTAAIAERDRTIISLHADLERQAEMLKKQDISSMNSHSSAFLMLTRQYEEERSKGITLREQLGLANGEVNTLRNEMQRLMQENRTVISKLSEARWEKAELLQTNNELKESNRILNGKLQDRECQLKSRKAALTEERNAAAAMGIDKMRLSEQVRTLQRQFNRKTGSEGVLDQSRKDRTSQVASAQRSGHTGNNSLPVHVNLYSLVERSCLMGFELQKGNDGLGFSLVTEQLPDSLGTCIIVQSVRNGSCAEHHIVTGDEIVEIDGQFCRNLPQSVAAACLRCKKASVQIVVSRKLNTFLHSAADRQTGGATAMSMPHTGATGNDTVTETLQSLCEQMHHLIEDLRLQRTAVDDTKYELEQTEELVTVKSNNNLLTVKSNNNEVIADTNQALEQRRVKGPDLLDIAINDRLRQDEAGMSSSLTNMKASLSAILDIVNEIRQTQLLQRQDSSSIEQTIVPQGDNISNVSSLSHMECVQDLLQNASSPVSGDNSTADSLIDTFQVYSHLPNSFPSSTHEEAVASAIAQLLPAIEDVIDKKLKQENRREDNEKSTELGNNLSKRLQEERKMHADDKTDYQEEIAQLQADLYKTRTEHKVDKERISHHVKELDKLAHAEIKLQAKIDENEQTLAKQQEEIKQAHSELSKCQSDNQTLYLQLNGLQEDHATVVKEKEELRQALAALQTNVESNSQLHQMTVDSHRQQEDELRQELNAVKTVLTQMEMQMQMKERELEETHREKEQELDSFKQQLAHTEADKKEIEADRDRIQEVCSGTVISHDQTLLQLHRLQDEAAKARCQLLDMKKQYDLCESQRSQVEQTLQHTQRQLNTAERELTDCKSQLKSKETSLQDTIHQLNERKVKLTETETRLVSVEQTNHEMQLQLTANKEAEFQLHTEMVRMQASHQAQEKLVEEWTKQLAVNKNDITELRQEKNKYQVELKNTQEKLKKQIEEQSYIEGRIQETEGSLAAMRDREKMLEDQLGSALQRAKEKESENAVAMEALQTRNLLLQEELASKDASLMKSTHSHADTSGRMQQLSKELERIRQELSQQRETAMKQQADMIKQQADYQQMAHKVKKREERIETMENEMMMLHQTNDILTQTAREEQNISKEKVQLEKLVQELQLELSAKEETLRKTESAVTRLQSERLSLQQKISSQEGEVLACQVNLAQITRQSQKDRTQNEQLTARLQTLAAEISGLMEQNEQLRASRDELSGEIETVTRDKEKSDEKVKTMEFAFEEQRMKSVKLAQENGNLTVRLESELKTVSDMNKKINGNITEISALQQVNALQQMQLEQSTAANDEVKAQLDNEKSRTKAEAEKLRHELQSQREESLINRVTAVELQNDLGKARQDLAHAAESMERQQELSRIDADAKQQLEEERRRLKQQLDREEEKTARLEEQNQEVQLALTKTHEQLSELSKRLEQAQTTSKAWKAKSEEREMEVDRLNTDRHQAVDENSELRRSLHEADSNQRKLTEELRAQSDRADLLEGTVGRLNDELQQAIRSRDENENALSIAEAKIKSLSSRNQDVERTIEQLTAIQSGLQQSVAQVNEERDKMVTSLESRIEVLKRDIQKKTDALESQTTSKNEMSMRLEVAEKESKRVGELQGQLSELQAKLANAETSLENTTRELAEVKTNAAVLQGERDQLMAILREQGIQKHTEKPSTPAATKRLRAGTASNQDVLVLLKDKDEEAQRLKEYVDKLLSAVIDKAPFVLEAIT